jgi:DNA replication protein DnaC
MLKRLQAARLDASHGAELRKLIRVDLQIVDDFALHQLDPVETQAVYDIVVERHRRAAVVTSNRLPDECLSTMADPLLA